MRSYSSLWFRRLSAAAESEVIPIFESDTTNADIVYQEYRSP